MAATGPGALLPLAMGDWIEVRFHCQNEFQAGINVRHYVYYLRSGEETLNLGQFVQNLYDGFGPLYRAAMSNAAVFAGVDGKVITRPPFSAPALVAPPAAPGLIVSPPLPNQVSAIASLYTLYAGQQWRGRVYIPFPPQTASDALGNMTAAFRDGPLRPLVAKFAETAIVIGTTGVLHYFRPSIYRRPKEGPPPIEARMTAIAGSYSPGRFATQRRRGQYGQKNVLFTARPAMLPAVGVVTDIPGGKEVTEEELS